MVKLYIYNVKVKESSNRKRSWFKLILHWLINLFKLVRKNDKTIQPLLNVQLLIQTDFPILFEFLGDIKLNWTTINKGATRTLEHRRKVIQKTKKGLEIEVAFIDVIIQARAGTPRAVTFLDFMRKLFEELTEMMPPEERRLLKRNVYGLLTNHDAKYRNHLGEICFVHRYKKSTCYKLIQTEAPLDPLKPKGTQVDFVFYNSATNRNIQVEIVNFHLDIPRQREWNDFTINRYLTSKINAKLGEKGSTDNYYLAPILWGSIESLKPFIVFYETKRPSFPRTLTPCAYLSYHFKDNPRIIHRFGTIDTLLDDNLQN